MAWKKDFYPEPKSDVPKPLGGTVSLFDIAVAKNFSRPRSNNRSTNGGTVTLRRSSTTPHTQATQDSTLPTPSTEAPGHQQQASSASYETSADTRYSKDQLLEIYRAQQESDTHDADVSRLFTESWNPGQTNGTNGRGWGKSNDARDSHGPDVCWDATGSVQPIALEPMSDLEKSVSCFLLMMGGPGTNTI